jgi:hypothetical protein
VTLRGSDSLSASSKPSDLPGRGSADAVSRQLELARARRERREEAVKRWRLGAVGSAIGLPALLCSLPMAAQETTLKFGGHDWIVKDGGPYGPGPNMWSNSCAWVDRQNRVHLRIAKRDGKWKCAEVTTRDRLGFGLYQFEVVGRIDKLDRQVVLGLFPYPTPDVGGDGTNEIDIEFARWAIPTAPNGNFTVWPPTKERKQSSHTFEFALPSPETTHRILWSSSRILFQSLAVDRDGTSKEIARYDYKPADNLAAIPQRPMPLHFNLWLFRGKPPTDGKEVEIVIKSMTFTPDAQSLPPNANAGRSESPSERRSVKPLTNGAPAR